MNLIESANNWMNEDDVSKSVWKGAMDKPYVVKGTVGNTSNQVVGKYKSLEDAKKAKAETKDGIIYNNISGKIVNEESMDEARADWGELDISDIREFGGKYKELIDYVVDEHGGEYVGYTIYSDPKGGASLVDIIMKDGIITFKSDDMSKAIRSRLVMQ